MCQVTCVAVVHLVHVRCAAEEKGRLRVRVVRKIGHGIQEAGDDRLDGVRLAAREAAVAAAQTLD